MKRKGEKNQTYKEEKVEKMEESSKDASLPPIHHIKMDLNVNLFRETANKFKKTNWQFMKKKKG